MYLENFRRVKEINTGKDAIWTKFVSQRMLGWEAICWAADQLIGDFDLTKECRIMFADITGHETDITAEVKRNDWQAFMKASFSECWRVLAKDGVLVFKWYEYHIPLSQLRPYFPCEPLIGNRRPRNSKTHWLLFYKE